MDKAEMFEQIASFFEQQENWIKLKDCWISCGVSTDFRRLLAKAMDIDGGNK